MSGRDGRRLGREANGWWEPERAANGGWERSERAATELMMFSLAAAPQSLSLQTGKLIFL